MIRLFSLLWLLAAVPISDADAANAQDASGRDLQFARAFVDSLRAAEDEATLRFIDLDAWIGMSRSKLERDAALFYPGEPTSVRLLGTESPLQNGQRKRRIYFEYAYPDGYNIVGVVLHELDGQPWVQRFRVIRTEAVQVDVQSFALASKATRHYLVLALTIVIPLFILATAVACAYTPIPRYKSAWMILIAVDMGRLDLNWAFGNIDLAPTVGLFGASISPAGPLSSWLLSVSIPFGAICFWFCRGQYLRRARSVECES